MNIRPVRALKKAGRKLRRPLLRHLRRHALILMYHRVASVNIDPWELCVSPANFQQHLEVLSTAAEVMPLEELGSRCKSARAGRPTVALTFDDGYLDNAKDALPLLERYSAPATIFIATDWIGRCEPFWWDLLAEVVLGAPLPHEIAISIGPAGFVWQAPPGSHEVSVEERRTLHRNLWSKLQVATPSEREAALQMVCAAAGVNSEKLSLPRAMTADELRSVRDSGLVEIGAHTMSHCPLPQLTHFDQATEIEGSRKRCADVLGRLPASFAYPYGELDESSRAAVAAAGFARACTSNEDLFWAGGDPLLMPRVVAPNVGGDEFERLLRTKWLA